MSKKRPNWRYIQPVLETDTGGWVEYAKACVRTLPKELGKLAP